MPALPKDWPAVLFTHLAVVVCTGAAGWFVHTQGSAVVPLMDEWPLLAQWLDSDRDLLGWAFQPHNEHRYPLAKLIWLAGLAAGGGFRTGLYVTVGVLTATAVLLLWAARGFRGHARPADVVLPVLVLHLGHSFNLLMSYQVGFAVFAYAVAGWVWAARRLAAGGGPGWAAIAGGYGTLVALCGGFGLVFTPPLVGWAVVVAARSPRPAVRAVVAAFALAWVGYAGWVAGTLPASAAGPIDRTPLSLSAAAVGWLSVGAGAWPVSGHAAPRWLGGAVAVGAVLLAAGSLARDRRWDAGRAAVAAGLVGGVLLAAATAYTRGGGLSGRFVTPSAVVLAVGWLAVACRPTPPPAGWRAVGGWVGGAAVAGGLYWANVDPGLADGYYTRLVAHDLLADVKGGMSPTFLAGKYGGSIPTLAGDPMADHLRVFRRHAVGPFAAVADDPPFRPVPVSGVAVPVEFACPPDEFARSPRALPLPDPGRPIVGVRVRVANGIPAGWQRVELHWTDEGGAKRSAWAYPPWVAARMALAFPVTGRPTGLRLVAGSLVHPFTIEAVEWLATD